MTPIAYIVAAIFGGLCFWAGHAQGRASMEREVESAWKVGFDTGHRAANLNRAIIATRIPLPPDTPSASTPHPQGSAAA